MHVVVIGAGIAGLVTALGLRRHEHQVTVYERKTEEVFATEGGAAIQLQVNAMRILKTWQIDISSVAHNNHGTQFRRYDTGEVVAEHLPHTGDQYWMLRSDFRRLIYQLAKDNGVKFRFDKSVQGLNQSIPAVTFSDVQEDAVRADLIVGADGVRSQLRHFLVPEFQPTITTECAFNLQVPFADMPDELREDLSSSPQPRLYMGPGHSLVTGSIPSRQCQDLQFLVHDYGLHREASQELLIENMGSTDYITERYSDYNPAVRELLKLTKECWKWRFVEATIDTWTSQNGRVILAGDACHAMVPHAAQGAGMCVEDAAVLSELYREGVPSDPARAANLARTYQEMRKPRTDKVQQRARMAGMTWAITDPDQQRKRDQRLKAQEQKKGQAEADENARPSSIAFEVWLEDYDALAEAKRTLQEMQQKVQARL